MNPLILVAAAAAGLAMSRAGRRAGKRAKKAATGGSKGGALPAECSGLGARGGRLQNVDYIEFVTGGAGENDMLPMVISLHGLGYDNTAHVKWLKEIGTPVRVILPNGFFEKQGSSRRAWWPSYSDAALKQASQWLASFVWMIQRCRPTRGKPIITGHSMGGFVALDFATQFPELIGGAVPVAATRSKRLWDIEPRVPVYGIHGELDGTFGRANEYYYAMYERGLPVSMTAVAGAPHRITTEVAGPWREVLVGLTT